MAGAYNVKVTPPRVQWFFSEAKLTVKYYQEFKTYGNFSIQFFSPAAGKTYCTICPLTKIMLTYGQDLLTYGSFHKKETKTLSRTLTCTIKGARGRGCGPLPEAAGREAAVRGL